MAESDTKKSSPGFATRLWRLISNPRDRGAEHQATATEYVKDASFYLRGRRIGGWAVRRPHDMHKRGVTTTPPTIRMRPPEQNTELGRTQPYILRGRDSEFSILARAISDMPQPIIAIEGPAGVGKSTLLEAAAQYANHQGFLHLPIDPNQIGNRQTFIDAIRDTMAPKLRHALRPTNNTPQGFQQLINDFGDKCEWENLPGTICQQAVAFAQDCNFHGILLTIDEAQKWLTGYPDKESTTDFAGPLLSFLNDSAPKKKIPITCIIAGTHGTIDAGVRILSPRFADQSHIKLANIHENAVKKIINDRLNFITPEGIIPATIPEPIVDKVVKMAQGHLAHITSLTNALIPHALHAAENNLTVIPPEDPHLPSEVADSYPSIIRDLQQAREEHYQQRFNDLAKSHAENESIMQLFAHVQKRLQGSFLIQELAETIKHFLATWRNVQPDTITPEVAHKFRIELMRRNIITHVNKGLLSTEPNEKAGAPVDYYITPTPSFSDYLTQRIATTNPQLHTQLTAQAETIIPELRDPLPLWQPPETGKIYKYTPVLKEPARGIVTAETLQPLLECDPLGTRLTPADSETLRKHLNLQRENEKLPPIETVLQLPPATVRDTKQIENRPAEPSPFDPLAITADQILKQSLPQNEEPAPEPHKETLQTPSPTAKNNEETAHQQWLRQRQQKYRENAHARDEEDLNRRLQSRMKNIQPPHISEFYPYQIQSSDGLFAQNLIQEEVTQFIHESTAPPTKTTEKVLFTIFNTRYTRRYPSQKLPPNTINEAEIRPTTENTWNVRFNGNPKHPDNRTVETIDGAIQQIFAIFNPPPQAKIQRVRSIHDD